jgi:hypothetical protein
MALKSTTGLADVLDLQAAKSKGLNIADYMDELQGFFHNSTGHTHLGTGDGEPPVIPFAGLSTDVLQKQSTTLTAAQVKALNTTPIAIVTAGGANTIIKVDSIVAVLDYGTTAFTGGNALEFRYTNGSGVKVASDLASGTFLNLTADAFGIAGAVEAQVIAAANAAVVVSVPTADPAAGDSTLDIHVYYRVVSVAT